MHLDTLSGLERIGICTAYRCEGEALSVPPADVRRLAATEPTYEFLPGWSEDLSNCRRFEDLPAAARRYVNKIETLVGVRVAIIGVGPDRAETIVRGPLQSMVSTSQVLSP